MTKFKDVAHLYLGCECLLGDSPKVEYIRMVNETKLSICTGTNRNNVPMWFKANSVKPILRKLSDITDAEIIEFESTIKRGHTTGFVVQAQREAQRTNWLLSKGFDLFGLIESNQAIDASTLK